MVFSVSELINLELQGAVGHLVAVLFRVAVTAVVVLIRHLDGFREGLAVRDRLLCARCRVRLDDGAGQRGLASYYL